MENDYLARLEFLFNAAVLCKDTDVRLSQFYIRTMRKLADKQLIRLYFPPTSFFFIPIFKILFLLTNLINYFTIYQFFYL